MHVGLPLIIPYFECKTDAISKKTLLGKLQFPLAVNHEVKEPFVPPFLLDLLLVIMYFLLFCFVQLYMYLFGVVE